MKHLPRFAWMATVCLAAGSIGLISLVEGVQAKPGKQTPTGNQVGNQTVNQGGPPDHAPAWGYRCNQGMNVNHPGNRSCGQGKSKRQGNDQRPNQQQNNVLNPSNNPSQISYPYPGVPQSLNQGPNTLPPQYGQGSNCNLNSQLPQPNRQGRNNQSPLPQGQGSNCNWNSRPPQPNLQVPNQGKNKEVKLQVFRLVNPGLESVGG
jgi:hypothetical protein